MEDYLNLLSSENQMISGVVAKFVNKLVGSVMSSQNSESALLFLGLIVQIMSLIYLVGILILVGLKEVYQYL